MLPEAFLLLLSAAISSAQTRQELSINQLASFNTSRLPNPPSFNLPDQDELNITVALCAGSNAGPFPRFFVSNSTHSAIEDDPGPSGGTDVYEIMVGDGHGSWTGKFPSGGVLAVDVNGAPQTTFEIGVSNADPMHEVLTNLPLFGDSTANQALIFSAPFLAPSLPKPSYPNYTLPGGNLSFPDPPSSSPNFTIIVQSTASGIASGHQTGCFLSSQRSSLNVNVVNQTLWLKDADGWRSQWILGGLSPSTNYTVYVVQDSTKVSGPIYFATKSAAYSCPLVASLPYCPGIAYTIPLPAPPPGAAFYDNGNLPEAITTPLISYLTNFTVSLGTFACGRDIYSPLVGCDDCQREYRKWLCAITFPRCGEPSPSSSGSFTSSSAPASATGLSAVQGTGDAQKVFSALVPQDTGRPELRRNQNFPEFTNPYSLLLPCIETCNVVDRTCPAFLGFRCPLPQFNAAATYGVGYIDSTDGDQDKGATGAAQDRWGNVWCNSG
ncbi:stretch-activated Ca2+-permeable channel component-domain-containing protein [Cyathus striatus]|nr:stretch-activated Ca2+-permeable channel component-domain-containing protein [Cyathus striatus]